MSSETKKVVNLDRPRDGAADEERPDIHRDDVDKLLADFLEHINSLSAEFESTPGEIPESPGELASQTAPESVAQTIVNMAAAIQQEEPPRLPTIPTEPEPQEPAPLPFGRDTTELDEEIERALSALEELPSANETPSGETAAANAPATPASVSSEAERAPTAPVETQSGKSEPIPAVEVAEARPDVNQAPAPSPTPAVHVQPVFTYSPHRVGSRRLVIAAAILGGVALLALVIYLLSTRSRPRISPGVGAQTSSAPVQAPTVSAQPAPQSLQSESPVAAVPARPQPATGKNQVAKETRSRTRGSGTNTSVARTESAETRPRQPEVETPKPVVPAPVPATPVMQQTAVPPAANAQQSPPQTTAAPVQLVPGTAPASTPSAAPRQTENVSSPAPGAPATPPSAPAVSNSASQTAAPPPRTAQPSSNPAPQTLPAAPVAPRPTPSRTPQQAPPTAIQSATPAELISKVLPNYPDFARRMNQTGSVELEIEIDAQGKVTKATPVSGPAIFHTSAVEAVRKWRFKPATLNGDRVTSHGKVTVVFNKR